MDRPDTQTPPAGGRPWPLWAGVAALAAAAVFSWHHFGLAEGLRQLVAAVESMGVWGPVLFVAIYIGAAILLVPGSILTLGAGAAFGLWRGFALVSLASTLGAAAAFLVGRYLARGWVERRVRGSAGISAVDEAIAREGWRVVGLIRLTPLVPYTLLNYALSLTRVRLLPYVCASWAGMIPGTLMYVYLGSLGNTVASEGKTPGEWALFGFGLVATAAVTLLITRSAKRALAESIGRDQATGEGRAADP